jgi:hypothetical protein
MQPQRLIECAKQHRLQLSNSRSETAYVNGSHLFGLGFGRARQAGFLRLEQSLKG